MTEDEVGSDPRYPPPTLPYLTYFLGNKIVQPRPSSEFFLSTRVGVGQSVVGLPRVSDIKVALSHGWSMG